MRGMRRWLYWLWGQMLLLFPSKPKTNEEHQRDLKEINKKAGCLASLRDRG